MRTCTRGMRAHTRSMCMYIEACSHNFMLKMHSFAFISHTSVRNDSYVPFYVFYRVRSLTRVGVVLAICSRGIRP